MDRTARRRVIRGFPRDTSSSAACGSKLANKTMDSAVDGGTGSFGHPARTAVAGRVGSGVPYRADEPDDDTRPDVDPRILVVEDDELVREFAVRLIKSLGYPVASAGDGMEAMRIIEESPTIDLLFTDIVMPGVDGIILADMVKQRRPILKILYTTGYRDIARAKSEAGILHGRILEKPYRPAELESEIRRLLP